MGQTSSFFGGIIKLADEGNTLDVMNLAFSRALDRGLCRHWINSRRLDMEGAGMSGVSNARAIFLGRTQVGSVTQGEFCDHLGQDFSLRFYFKSPLPLANKRLVAPPPSGGLRVKFLTSISIQWAARLLNLLSPSPIRKTSRYWWVWGSFESSEQGQEREEAGGWGLMGLRALGRVWWRYRGGVGWEE